MTSRLGFRLLATALALLVGLVLKAAPAAAAFTHVCDPVQFGMKDFTGYRVQFQTARGFRYSHIRLSFCSVGHSDRDDAYYPVASDDAGTGITAGGFYIPWGKKICAVARTSQRQLRSPRCFVMARRNVQRESDHDRWGSADPGELDGGPESGSGMPDSAETDSAETDSLDESAETDSLQVAGSVDGRRGAGPFLAGAYGSSSTPSSPPLPLYLPGTWIGGLFGCPGDSETDNVPCNSTNAVPLRPLIADNPLNFWSESPDGRHTVQRVPLAYTFMDMETFGYGPRGTSRFRADQLPSANWHEEVDLDLEIDLDHEIDRDHEIDLNHKIDLVGENNLRGSFGIPHSRGTPLRSWPRSRLYLKPPSVAPPMLVDYGDGRPRRVPVKST